MSAKIVNLRNARKRSARIEKAKTAEENSVSYGLNKDARMLSKARKLKSERELDGHKRDIREP